MAVTQMSLVVPLSLAHTHESVASAAAVITNTLDNERIQWDNIRNYINQSISYLGNLLNLSSSPWYGIWMAAALESGLHITGLEYVDLSDSSVGVTPSNYLASIQKVNYNRPAIPVATDWIGNLTRYDLAEMTQLNSQMNLQHRFTIGWCHNGSDLLVFCGNNITTPNRTATTEDHNVASQSLTIVGQRKPLLDNLFAMDSASGSNNYRAKVDLPDEYIELLIKMTQKKMIEQLREQVPAQLEQEVNQGVAQITANIQSELEFEKAEREKRRYGAPQKPPGANA